METLKDFFSGAAFVVGTVLLSYAALSYEDEEKRYEKKFKNWYEEAWIALDNKEKGFSVRLKGFLLNLLIGQNKIFNRLYGSPLVYIRSFAVGVCLVTGGIAVGVSIFSGWDTWKSLVILACTVPPFLRSNWPSYVASLMALALLASMMRFLIEQVNDFFTVALFVFVFFFETFLIAVIRKFFLIAQDAKTLRQTLVFILSGTLVVPVYFVIPVSMVIVADQPARVEHIIRAFAIFNFMPTLTSLSFLLLLLISVVLRILYAILPRAVYMPIKLKLLDNRKATAAIGIALMGMSTSSTISFIEKAAKTMGLSG